MSGRRSHEQKQQFSPSEQYLQSLYDALMEEERKRLNGPAKVLRQMPKPLPTAVSASEMSDEMKQKLLKQVQLQQQMAQQAPLSSSLKRPMARPFGPPSRDSDLLAPAQKRPCSPASRHPSSASPALSLSPLPQEHPLLPTGPLRRVTSTGAKLPSLPILTPRGSQRPPLNDDPQS